MADRATIEAGVRRSLDIYYSDPARQAAMDALHARFARPGDLVFDVGAHVGDRVGSFRRLGCRVVAVEPQPALVEALTRLYGADDGVTIEPVAVGAEAGMLELFINAANPTISTASPAFIAAASDAPGWEGQVWSDRIEVPVTTLDGLIARHGRPVFVKIDVEGFEAEVLAGLSEPVAAVSFEFTTIQRDVAHRALARLTELGYRNFDACLGESQSFAHGRWIDAAAIAGWLDGLPIDANSGDVYAVRAD